eukprot:TRINITY_DN9889_c0_g1_i2.p1 TRINITY_DN9889_c0_g1~~TRINITY_DN9889_c0_g1_i2.p1  ORF type:complete len:567 (-),score=122.52 TRINITY_DN9889_c0_g1_i2:213-1913(-)
MEKSRSRKAVVSTQSTGVKKITMQVELTAGAAAAMARCDTRCQAVVMQVCAVEQLPPKLTGTQKRHRLRLSDGENYVDAIAGTALAKVLDEIVPSSVISITEYLITSPSGRPIPVILAATVLQRECQMIGNPSPTRQEAPLTNSSATTIQAPPPSSMVPQQVVQPAPKPSPPERPIPASLKLVTIKSLNPYLAKWAFKGRCTAKSAIREWYKDGKTMRLFTADFVDNSAEIRAVCFTAQVDKFYPIVQVTKVYVVTNGQIKLANRKWSTLDNDYEFALQASSDVIAVCDDDSVPHIRLSFTSIATLMCAKEGTMYDVFGVATQVSDETRITTKAGVEVEYRAICIADTTNYCIRLVMWGKKCQLAQNVNVGDVIAVKSAKLNGFQGKTLSSSSFTNIFVNPTGYDSMVRELTAWFQSPSRQDPTPLSSRSHSKVAQTAASLVAIRDITQTPPDFQSVFQLRATVQFIKTTGTLYYPSCPTSGCAKKVVPVEGEGPPGWHCPKCSKIFSEPLYRHILRLLIADHTGGVWVSCFNDVAEIILGVPASTVFEWRNQGQEKQWYQRRVRG